MKTLHSKIYVILFVLFAPLFSSASCEKNSESDEYSSLDKAIAKAKEVVDVQMPGAKLAEINGIVIDENGNTTSDGEWTFYYFKEVGESYEYYAVTVSPGGEVLHWNPSGAICFVEIPSYATASLWVSTADNIMNDLGVQYENRSVQVFADYDDIYPATDYTVYIYYYMNSNDEHIAYIILDADNCNTLLIEDHP